MNKVLCCLFGVALIVPESYRDKDILSTEQIEAVQKINEALEEVMANAIAKIKAKDGNHAKANV